MALSGMDLSSNWVAGVRLNSKNNGSVGPAAVKSGQGDRALNAALNVIVDIATLDTYLAASTLHGVGYYTAIRLAQMSKSDKVHAAQLIADPTSFR